MALNLPSFDELMTVAKKRAAAERELALAEERCIRCGGDHPPETLTNPATGEQKQAAMCKPCRKAVVAEMKKRLN